MPDDLDGLMKDREFCKMHGSGNDFVLMDNRSGLISRDFAPDAARVICRRKFGVGADGLILIEDSEHADFKWGFYNADGSEAEMCGNGGRCAARFAFMKGIAPSDMTFETIAGTISAHVNGQRVKLELSQPRGLFLDRELEVNGSSVRISFLNTGVPHVVVVVEDINDIPVVDMGRAIRMHDFFAPDGTNVNFAAVQGADCLAVRTYERGVEDETMACGTGSVASAIILSLKGFVKGPVDVVTRGGEILRVYHDVMDDGTVAHVFLEGDTVVVYTGVFQELSL